VHHLRLSNRVTPWLECSQNPPSLQHVVSLQKGSTLPHSAPRKPNTQANYMHHGAAHTDNGSLARLTSTHSHVTPVCKPIRTDGLVAPLAHATTLNLATRHLTRQHATYELPRSLPQSPADRIACVPPFERCRSNAGVGMPPLKRCCSNAGVGMPPLERCRSNSRIETHSNMMTITIIATPVHIASICMAVWNALLGCVSNGGRTSTVAT